MRRATLNNWGDIERKRVRIGAKVWIRRSNEVIPEIMGRVDEFEADERDVEKPDQCPACGAKLIEKGAHLYCPNRDGCEPQIVMRLSHYAGREAMDIDTFSEKTAAQLYRALGVAEPSSLYEPYAGTALRARSLRRDQGGQSDRRHRQEPRLRTGSLHIRAGDSECRAQDGA